MSSRFFQLFNLIFLSLCFTAQGFDLKKAVKESAAKLNQEADTIEAKTNEEYSKNSVEIENQRKIDIQHKEETDRELTALLEEEAKLDRIPPTNGPPIWENIPSGYLKFMDDWFKKNDFRSGMEDCSIAFPHDIRWAQNDEAAVKKVYDHARWYKNSRAADAKAAVDNMKNTYNERSARAGHEVSPDKYQMSVLDREVQSAEAAASESNGTLACENSLSPEQVYYEGLYIEVSYQCRPNVQMVLDGKVGGMEAVKRVLAAKSISAKAPWPGQEPKNCWDMFKETRVYNELYTDKYNQWNLAPLVEMGIKKLKAQGTWFPSRQMYQWASDLDGDRDANRYRSVASWTGEVRKFTDDEVLRHYNVVRRMKAFDPLYAKYLSTLKK